MAPSKAKAATKPRRPNETTSVYLGNESRARLIELAQASGQSRSEVVSRLIMRAGSEDRLRLRALVAEMSDLLDGTT
jgi:hypothetical protein